MKRHIKVEIIEAEGFDKAMVRVVEQTHRGDEFGKHNNKFVSKDGFSLCSCSCPFSDTEKSIFVRGDDKGADNTVFTIDKFTILPLIQAINEYNNLETDNSKDDQNIKRHVIG